MLECNQYYHIYNHANGFENIFNEDKNYTFFLEKTALYLKPVVEIYAYCLMPNHFHLVIKVRSESEIMNCIPYEENSVEITPYETITRFISKQFSNLFSSYTQSFNKVYKRRGSLFIKNFKRKKIEDLIQLQNTIIYLHLNAVKHGFKSDFRDWPWTSFYSYFNDNKPDWLQNSEVEKWFGNKNLFEELHTSRMEIILSKNEE